MPKCLFRYQWVKLPRTHLPVGKGIMGYWAKLGTAMEVLINDEWIPTRIEYGNDWYLVGVQKESLPGLQVRI